MTRWSAGAAALLALAACSCRTEQPLEFPAQAAPQRTTPELDTRVRVNPETGVMTRQWQVLLLPGGGTRKHGFERGWYPDGAREYERAFVEGQEMGLWRSWYADGTLRSEYEWAVDGGATLMRFWHPNGGLSAEGLAARGLREGPWTFWYEGGGKREQGEYRGNARHGAWVVYREDGSVRSRGRYANDQRVGDWQHPPRAPGRADPAGAREADQ